MVSADTKNGLEITYRDVSELVPYARNARTHSDQQIDQIAASIREFGWTNPSLPTEQTVSSLVMLG